MKWHSCIFYLTIPTFSTIYNRCDRTSLYEELHNQQIAIIQEFLDKVKFDQTKIEQEYTNLKDEQGSEVVPYAAYQTQDWDQMQGQEHEQAQMLD